MNVLVIANPRAGHGKAIRLLAKIQRLLSTNPHEFHYTVSRFPEEMRQSILDAAVRGYDAILLAGGDGTIHEAFPAIASVDIPFGVLAAGRGNDFARNIGIPLDLQHACRFAHTPVLRTVDLPTINGIPFGSIACVGFDAMVNKMAREHQGYFDGTIGYIICVLKALRRFTPFQVDLTVDGRPWKGSITMLAMANGPCYGGGMKIAPDAVIDDGRITLCIVRELSGTKLLRQFPRVFRGTHVAHPSVMTEHGRHITVMSANRQEIFADGEYCGTLPAECNIGFQTVKVMMPALTTIHGEIEN